jgi:prepilin-type N-terminal cleavage/methylation domain-containing protein
MFSFLNKLISSFKTRQTPCAFSLIEVSVVIIIIGIFIAGIVVANGMVSKFRLAAAESLTQSSPIVSIKENILWLETSLGTSFSGSEANDGSSISSWNDQKVSSPTKISVVAVGSGPEYANTINRIHAVKFDAASATKPSSANHLIIPNASFLNNTNYTIVVLEKRQSSASNNYFIGAASSNPNDSLALGYKSDSTIIHAQGSNSYTSAISSYANSTDKPRLFVFVSSSEGKKTYVNGILAAESSSADKLNGVISLEIGKGYTGEIGEIAIFNKALDNQERKDIEDYLSKKWSKKLHRDAVVNGSCIGGIITESGCSMDCVTSTINGVTSPSTVSDGASGVDAACGGSGYKNTISLSCSGGIISKSSDCPCDDGYSPSGGECIPTLCSITSVAGLSDKTNLPYATNAAAIPSTPTASCASGYSGSPTYTCASSGPATIVDNCSPITCSITGVAGFNNKTGLAYATTSTAISAACQSGYDGSPAYTCNSSGPATISGSCSPITCSITGVAGLNNKTGLAYTATAAVVPNTPETACASGYSGSPTYTCTSSGPATVVSNCTTPLSPCSVTGSVTTDTTTVAGSTIHKFTGNGSITCPTARTVQVLMIGGGGGGGHRHAGGGGAGGFLSTSVSLNTSAYNIIVGAGGVGAVSSGSNNGASGQNTTFAGLTAYGGGGGGSNSKVGIGGASGGGGSNGNAGGNALYGSQGNKGGSQNNGSGCCYAKGNGGGGAGAAGANTLGDLGSAGGVGLISTITGTTTYYAGGGGGGNGSGAGYLGGNGGGGNGGSNSQNCTAAQANSGGGGGGGGVSSENGCNGGSGVLIVRY